MRNIPKMFPKEMIECELVNEENSLEIFLEIKKTTNEIKKKKEKMKAREERYMELQRFIHAKKLTGTFETAKEQLLEMISKEDFEIWSKRNEQFKTLLTSEIDLLFREP